jgi:hypothetical protein
MPPLISPTQRTAANKMSPKIPNITVKKAVSKMAATQPVKAASKSGVKAPFSKMQKAPPTKKKPETWTQEK